MIHALSKKGQHLVIYMPVDIPDHNVAMRPEAWICDSYEEAIETLEEFIKGEDFIPEIDARFEIFDDAMEPCADQRVIEDLIMEVLTAEEMEGFPDVGPPVPVEEGLAQELEEERRAATGTAIREEIIITPPASTPKPEAKKEKEVQFDEIEIEDKRG